MKIGQITYAVKDYDEAIRFFTTKLGFILVSDTDMGNGKRWVTVCPEGGKGVQLLLAKAVGEQQTAIIGRQAGGRVFLFLYTDDIYETIERFKTNEVKFKRQAEKQPWGTTAVFEDLYGNYWDLIESPV